MVCENAYININVLYILFVFTIIAMYCHFCKTFCTILLLFNLVGIFRSTTSL